MGQLLAALDAVWKVTAVGLVLGAGLPALFSLGVRAQASGKRAWAAASYAVVGLAVVAGIAVIVAHGLGFKL
ncbi:MAG TPA: hypothetical protein PLK46_00135 [Propioniciclava sp.]|jgi:hypothetical protein|uniref:hypothetical protein n=1 Tax=Propioniciclava sp. TaxID=2038686 RepID=UPI002C9EA114|nr:hypothetical protein [Propioniciclava sp.]HRL48739.1 hypothetical protein [Propioniciclava sp.]HRL78721.1 hypothetical protein [Propioniciclava sp.]